MILRQLDSKQKDPCAFSTVVICVFLLLLVLNKFVSSTTFLPRDTYVGFLVRIFLQAFVKPPEDRTERDNTERLVTRMLFDVYANPLSRDLT